MSPLVSIPAPLRADDDPARVVTVSAETVGEALATLARQRPRVESYLFDREGNLRAFVNVFVNSDDVRALDGLATRVSDRDEIVIVPTIAGG